MTHEPAPETPREGRGGTLSDVATAIDGLVVLTRAGLRRSILALVACGVLLAVSTVFSAVLYFRARAQSEHLVEVAARLEAVAAELTKTRAATEQVQERVNERAAAEETKPTVEIQPAPAKAGKPPGAVVVIRPPKAMQRPTAEPAPAPIEIPIKLPEGATQAPADAGLEKR